MRLTMNGTMNEYKDGRREESCLHRREEELLERVLRNMQAAYDGGVTWADLTNLALVPTRAMNDAILG